MLRAAELGDPAADRQHVVVARRAEVLDGSLAQEHVAGISLDVAMGVGQADLAPVLGDRGVDVGEVMAVDTIFCMSTSAQRTPQPRRADKIRSRHGGKLLPA